jgi:hypothetical protein
MVATAADPRTLRAASPVRRLWRVGCILAVVLGARLEVGCATAAVVDPRITSVRTVALVSLYARSDVVDQDTMFPGAYVPAGLAAEVIDMISADVEGDLEGRFGVDNVVPLRQATRNDSVLRLPAARPSGDWTQSEGAVAVDIDHPDIAAHLADAARALDVDAVVVMRHEWWVSRVRYQRSAAVVGHDRCAILVVDAGGRVVWKDSVVAQESSSQLWLMPGAPGFATGIGADEARRLARKTARSTWKDLLARERTARPSR